MDTIQPPASWGDWPRFANDLEAPGASEVYRLTLQPGLVGGEVRYLDGALWEIRTGDGALHSSAWLLGEEGHGFSVFEVTEGRLVQRIDLRGAGRAAPFG